MRLIERYLFRQMLGPALWALASLAAVGMLSQSLSALELIVEQRQSAWVFIKIIVLGMPQILAVILPLAIFVAALPASLGFCGASCVTQRELWPGLLGGFVTVLFTLGVVGMVLPVHGIA